MATQAYWDWVNAGRPFNLAIPVRQYRDAFRAAGWPALSIGTLGDEPHLQADTPQDHCPFSYTGWPVVHPYPYVTAIDVSHNGIREAQLDSIVAQWVADARAGHTPWVKYIIYKGQSWSVRSGWETRSATGHYDHAHASIRSDHVGTSVGAYNPLGQKGSIAMDDYGSLGRPPSIGNLTGAVLLADLWGQETLGHSPYDTAKTYRTRQLDAIDVAVKAIAARPQLDPVEFAKALAANPEAIEIIASAVASRVGMIPTAGEIARAVGDLTWHGRTE